MYFFKMNTVQRFSPTDLDELLFLAINKLGRKGLFCYGLDLTVYYLKLNRRWFGSVRYQVNVLCLGYSRHSGRDEAHQGYGFVVPTRVGEHHSLRTICVGGNCILHVHAPKIAPINWHTLRHTHGTLLHEQGTPLRVAQAQLGHSHMTTTLEVYTHAGATSQRQAVNQLENQLFPNVPKFAEVERRPTETRDGILKEIPQAYEDVDEVVEQRLSGARLQRS